MGASGFVARRAARPPSRRRASARSAGGDRPQRRPSTNAHATLAHTHLNTDAHTHALPRSPISSLVLVVAGARARTLPPLLSPNCRFSSTRPTLLLPHPRARPSHGPYRQGRGARRPGEGRPALRVGASPCFCASVVVAAAARPSIPVAASSEETPTGGRFSLTRARAPFSPPLSPPRIHDNNRAPRQRSSCTARTWSRGRRPTAR